MTISSLLMYMLNNIGQALFTMTLFKMPILIMFLHFLADFVFQSNKMAQGKSSSWKWLLAHVGTYGLIFFVGLYFFVSFKFLLYYVGINVLLHLYIDSKTSKITKRLWAEKKVHEFFVAIGFDQFLHYLCLYLTWMFKSNIIFSVQFLGYLILRMISAVFGVF